MDSPKVELSGQVGVTGAVGGEEGKDEREGREEDREGGHLGERGLVEVKNLWTLWCWRTRGGNDVRHLDESRDIRQRGGKGQDSM